MVANGSSVMQRIWSAVYTVFVITFACPMPVVGMTSMSDEDMQGVAGQGLFVGDKILGTELNGANALSNPFTFYRMGMDVDLELNANIDKLQLGCGGLNDGINNGVCDIDLDYVRFLGRCTTPSCGQNSFATDNRLVPGAGAPVTSSFLLKRPTIEVAVKNDTTATLREVVGIKIGAERADGFIGIGGFEGGTHTGINAVSGSLGVRINGVVNVDSTLGSATTCIGSPSIDARCAAAGAPPFFSVPLARTTGTRMTQVRSPSIPLTVVGAGGLVGLLAGSGDTLYSDIRFELRQLHGFELNNTGDFFLSFQREQIAYPRSDKSGYAVAANTGWWMNVPQVDLFNLSPPTVDLGCPGSIFLLCAGLLGAFGEPGIYVNNPDLGSRPPQNCFGNSSFC